MAVITTSGGSDLLGHLRGNYLNALRVHLFKNNAFPKRESVLEDFVEADFSGYGSTRILSSWNSIEDKGDYWETRHAQVRWNHDGGGEANRIYGAYVTTEGGVLVWASRLTPADREMRELGDTITYTPTFKFYVVSGEPCNGSDS